jgi:hypothetical protein
MGTHLGKRSSGNTKPNLAITPQPELWDPYADVTGTLGPGEKLIWKADTPSHRNRTATSERQR